MEARQPDAVTLQHWIERSEARLRAGPHPERARRDAELLLLHMLGRDRAFLIAHPLEILTAEGAVRYHALIDRRLGGEPIQYITGECEFYGLPFEVTRDVLIPRPETEHLVEKAIEFAARFPQPRIVDIGTGSGAIAVALAHCLPDAVITATDIWGRALDLARQNAEQNQVSSRIRFLRGDLLGPVAKERFEIVVSNPPYVSTADRASLAVEVRDHEPALALFAGEDGLEIFRRIIPAAFSILNPGGFIVLEIGIGQAAAVRDLLVESGFVDVEFVPDLQSILRIACAQRP